MTESWVDKYRPETFDEIQGNTSDLEEIEAWAKNWSVGDQAILLVGPPGVGKTTTAEVVANYLGLQTVEINASSARESDDLEALAQQIRSAGEGGHRLVLIDEVDSWHHAVQKRVLYDALDSPGNPVVMTANDEYDVAHGLKSRSESFEFSLGVRSRKAKIKQIAQAEGLSLSSNEVSVLAQRPDLRSAINDMQMFADGEHEISSDSRSWASSEWDMLDTLLTGTPEFGDLPPDDALLWVDESLSAEYRGLEMAMGYDALALADVQLGKAQRGSYRHWKYASALIEEVGLIRQTEPYHDDEIGYNSKSFPEWFRHSKPSVSGDGPTQSLYRKLKGQTGMGFKGNYIEFIDTLLPIIKDQPAEELYKIALSYKLEPKEMKALGISQKSLENWIEIEQPGSGEWEREVESGSEW